MTLTDKEFAAYLLQFLYDYNDEGVDTLTLVAGMLSVVSTLDNYGFKEPLSKEDRLDLLEHTKTLIKKRM